MNFFRILKTAAGRWYNHDADHLAAALSYYTPFALTPLIFVSVTVLSYVYGSDFAVEMMMIWGNVLGPDMLSSLSDAIANLRSTNTTFEIPVIGSVFFFSMIIIAFNTLTSGFHTIWEIPKRGVRGWLEKSWRSVVFVFVLQAYLILIMGIDGFFLGVDTLAIQPLITAAIAFIATTWLFYLMYRFLTVSPHTRKASLMGALVASVLLGLAKSMIALYVDTAAVPKLYDAAGLIVALLIWIYAAASIVYFGAAVVHEYDNAPS
ncbi:YihY/virulence factor BrkB family protein [Patescibacteria group bacterium]|nr:YihY/virulence factor BrkB family protein [Patescibacteria group bacterium]